MTGLISFFLPSYPNVLVYMLQSTEYQPKPYLKWFWHTSDFRNVMKRRMLEKTRAARLLLLVIRLGIVAQFIAGLYLIQLGIVRDVSGASQLGVAMILSYPLVWAHLIVVPLVLGRTFIVGPKEKRLIEKSKSIFGRHPGVKIAVAGSYGKTTMKELLGTVLSEGKKVAITPANRNVAGSHAVFASKLKGDEDVLVIEYGEGRPGDVQRFARTTKPDIGVITGVAPAHLDQYQSLEAAGNDIFSLADYLHDKNVFVNADSDAARPYIRDTHAAYGAKGVDGWKVSKASVGFDGIKFSLSRGRDTIKIQSGLLGRHQIGPLAAAAVIARKIGLSIRQIEAGTKKTRPFEHRMQPYRLSGAWIVDDTYNGNIDGIQVGLKLLSELDAKRKIYVTPGLVDQGLETERVHLRIGEMIAAAKPDVVVLMQNSVTHFIVDGLNNSGFDGKLQIEEDPLRFYTNLEHFVAAGDLVLMQNDWTDNYN